MKKWALGIVFTIVMIVQGFAGGHQSKISNRAEIYRGPLSSALEWLYNSDDDTKRQLNVTTTMRDIEKTTKG